MENNKSQLKIGIVLNYINLILGNLIPVFYTPIMLSLLGQSEYGLYKLASNVTSYLTLISLGISSAVTRYLIKANTEEGKDSEEKILGLFSIIFRVIAAISFVVGIGLVFCLPLWYSESLSTSELQTMQILVFILSINTAVSFLMTPHSSVVISHEKFIFSQCINIVITCFAPILNLVMLFLGFASIGMVVSSLIVTIGIRIAYFVYVKKCIKMKAQYKNLPTHLFKEIIVFSFWIFVANVVVQLYNTTDTVMIGSVAALGTIGVAIYNVGAVFNNIVFSLTTGISGLLMPKTNKLVFSGATNSELTDLCIKVGRIQAYIISLVVMGFISFGRPFICFYVGADYLEAYWVAILMMVPNMIPLVQSVCLNIIVAQNKHRFRSLCYLGIAIGNVAATWFLMNTSLGIVGAALATGVALIIGQGFVMNWYYSKKTGLEIGRFWKKILKIYIIPVILCVVTLLLSLVVNFNNLVILIIGIIVFTILYCLLSWLFVMNDYEKDLCRSFLIKIKIKKNNQ